jgi:hypothetical protein
MKTTSPLLVIAVIGIVSGSVTHAAVTIVDTFDQGGFSITPSSGTFEQEVNLPLARRRLADQSRWATSPGASMTSTLNSGTGTLTFVTSGTSLSVFPMSLTLVYAGAPHYNIAGCTEFILGFSELSGVGTLYIELGGSNGLDGVFRVDLTGPGEVHYSVSDVYEGSGHTLDSFNVLTFRFESRSPQFSFTLDEIRLVPEPSGALLALVAGAGLLARRRRG